MSFQIGRVRVLTFFGQKRTNGKWFGYLAHRPVGRAFGARVILLPFVNIYIGK